MGSYGILVDKDKDKEIGDINVVTVVGMLWESCWETIWILEAIDEILSSFACSSGPANFWPRWLHGWESTANPAFLALETVEILDCITIIHYPKHCKTLALLSDTTTSAIQILRSFPKLLKFSTHYFHDRRCFTSLSLRALATHAAETSLELSQCQPHATVRSRSVQTSAFPQTLQQDIWDRRAFQPTYRKVNPSNHVTYS
jgi:hypothetical protein